jgi:hypothetical protein
MHKKPDSELVSSPPFLHASGPLLTKAPNPRRVLAGRLNRQKRGEITPAGRERLRRAALRNRPWRFSTGPKTAEGKVAAARNGRVRQEGPTSVRAARAEAREVRKLIQALRAAREAAG